MKKGEVVSLLPPKKVDPKLIWGLEEKQEEFDLLITQGYEYEAEGRKIASMRNEKISEEDETWAENMKKWHEEFYDALTHIKEEEEVVELILEALNSGIILFSEIRIFIIKTEESNIKRLSTLRSLPMYISYINDEDINSILSYLERYDDDQYNLTHREGIWMYKKLMTEDEYTYSALVNDATSVFHQLLNYLARKYQKLVVIVPEKVYSDGVVNPYLERLALQWNKATEIFNKENLYYSEDYECLYAIIRGTNLEMRVGSSEGHATHVEQRLRGIVATYYDTDEDVHEVFMKLCDYWGINVIEHKTRESTDIFAPAIGECDIKFMKAVLPFVTSMDYRLAEGYSYWKDSRWGKQYEIQKSKDLFGEDLELQMCIIAGSDILKEGG